MRIVIILSAPTTPPDADIAGLVAHEAARVARSKTPGGSLPVVVEDAYITEDLGEIDEIAPDLARVIAEVRRGNVLGHDAPRSVRERRVVELTDAERFNRDALGRFVADAEDEDAGED